MRPVVGTRRPCRETEGRSAGALQLDAFEHTMAKAREDIAAQRAATWRDFAWTLATIIGWGAVILLVLLGAPAATRWLGFA